MLERSTQKKHDTTGMINTKKYLLKCKNEKYSRIFPFIFQNEINKVEKKFHEILIKLAAKRNSILKIPGQIFADC